MAAKKHLLEEFDTLESVGTQTKAAKLRGVITNVSPMKSTPGKAAYFDGHLADETTSLRLANER